MKRSTLILAYFLTVSWQLTAQDKTKTDSLVFTRIHSNLLHEERKIVVHLPLNYQKETKKRYPVMFVLDAGRLDFDISDRLFALSSAGLSPECIVVGVLNNKGTRERDLTPPFMQTETADSLSPFGKADQFLGFLKNELIPHIDSSYRTMGYRTISGHSRAGLFVLYTLIEQPDMFQGRFCYSTPAWRFNNIIIGKLDSTLQKLHRAKRTYLYFSVGAHENPNILSAFHTMSKKLSQRNSKYLTCRGYLTPFADHQSNPVFSTANAIVSWAGYFQKQGYAF